MDETGASKYTGIEDFVFTTELVEKVIGRFSEGLEGKVETALARKEEVEIRGIFGGKVSTCIPSSSEVSVYCSEIFVNEFVRNDAQMDLPDEANDLLVTQILAILQRRAISTLVSPLLS